jgi:N-acetyl-anhydromuramyl-L-alanine amidase AmpD
MAYNPLVPAARRFQSTKKTDGRPVAKPTHVVIHITGGENLESVKNTFMTSTSIHYLIDKAGLIYQFVDEKNQAWHAGIKTDAQKLYNNLPAADWRKYLMYFSWYNYPAGTKFVDGNRNPTTKANAVFAVRPGMAEWPDYDYFKTRWGSSATPINYATSKRPNAYSVGIELLSFGAKTASAAAYTPAMYASLKTLVTDICGRNNIPQAKGNVVGHEDVNPVQRWGWDPNKGFDWSVVWA